VEAILHLIQPVNRLVRMALIAWKNKERKIIMKRGSYMMVTRLFVVESRQVVPLTVFAGETKFQARTWCTTWIAPK